MRTAVPGNEPRVALARAARVAALALLALAAAGAVAAWLRADRILDRLDRDVEHERRHLVDAVRKGYGLEFYASLDERTPSDFVTALPLRGSAAVRVPGVFGSARRFDGRPGQNLVAFKQRWVPFARGGLTLAFWLRFPELPEGGEMRVVWDHDEKEGIGLRIRDGRLEASFGDASGIRVLSAPAPEPGRFVHVAFAIGLDRAALYVDGAERDACGVSPPLALRGHYVSIGTDMHFPPVLDVDEWCVFLRALDAAETARLASARRPIPELFEPSRAARLRSRESRAAAFRSLLGALGAFRAPASSPAVLNRSVPVLELRLSRADRRHFRKAQLEALASGFRTDLGADPRRVQASFGGRTERIRAWLDETVSDAPGAARPAFVLAAEGGLFGDGSGLVRAFPPEQFGLHRPDAACPIPLDASCLVRLHLDGDFLGFYCLAPFEGPAAPWFATGPRDIARPDRLHFAASASDAASGAGLSGREREAAWIRMLALLRTDPNFPLGPAEANLLLARHRKMREAYLMADPEPGPEAVLGGNRSAFYVTEDLDLDAAGPGVSWRSSDPAAISPKGRVSRPEDGRPRTVELAAAFPGGAVRTFRFRVVPEEPALPALFLHFGRPLDKFARTDFSCLRVPAGGGGEPVWISGTGGGGGGAKLRGNTSFVAGRRRSMSLKFDAPVQFPGVDGPVRHILLLSGYADATRLRNALSFDVFRAVSPEGTVRAVPVSWTEVFVNGAYAGVWECCPRLRDAVSEEFSDLYKVRLPNGLWESVRESVEDVDRVARFDAPEESGPADPYAAFRELVRYVAETGSAAFAAGAAETFDLGELVDFFLLVNFTGNEDGRVTNQFVGRRASDGRWLLLPWDYDKTFLLAPAGAGARTTLLVSPLFHRLLEKTPGFRDRVRNRWRELRAGVLSEASLDAWIDGRAALLAPSMDEDYRVVPPLGHDGDYAAAVSALRAEVRARLALVDRWLGR